jgi:hypothetical protein
MENKMTPAWVVENYLPDYEKRSREAYIDNARWDLPHDEVERRFVDYHFPEALAELLKAQREVCERRAHQTYGEGWWGTNLSDAIALAPVPEPKNKQ